MRTEGQPCLIGRAEKGAVSHRLARMGRYRLVAYILAGMVLVGPSSTAQAAMVTSSHTMSNLANDLKTTSSSPLLFGQRNDITNQVDFFGFDYVPISFEWTGGGNFKFANRLTGAAPNSKESFHQTYLSIVPDIGLVTFTNTAGRTVSGPAPFLRPVPSAIVFFGGQLISTIFGSPAQVDFFSEIEQLGPSSFQYTYTVTNHTNAVVDFDWTAAGIAGTVNPDSDPNDPNDNVFVHSFMAPVPGTEQIGTASAMLSSGVVTVPAHAFQPAAASVPEPGMGTIWVLMFGSLLVTGRRRWLGQVFE